MLFREAWSILKENKLALVGMSIILLIITVAILAPFIATMDPMLLQVSDRLLPPGETYLFGTDDLGRDIFSRVVWGTRVSLTVSFFVVLGAGFAGIVIGLLAGYWERIFGFILMRSMDGLMAFPALLLALAIMAVRGTTLPNMILAIAVVYIPTFARLTRNQVMSIKEREFVEAARAGGGGSIYIMLRHILPNCMAPLIVQATVVFGYAILTEAALSFLGFGVAGQASWGAILSEGRRFLYDAPWISVFPGLAISFFVLGVNLTGDGLRDVFDPLMK